MNLNLKQNMKFGLNLNQSSMAIAAVVLVGVLGARFLVHPLHGRADAVDAAHERLVERIADWPGQDVVLDPIRSELDHRRTIVALEQHPIPASPDLAGLIRRLSLEIDGTRVLDQTFVAGRRGAASTAAPESWRSIPLTMELVSDFSTLQGVLGRIEESPEPVRITRLAINRSKDPTGTPGIARTTLVLDVVFRLEEASK